MTLIPNRKIYKKMALEFSLAWVLVLLALLVIVAAHLRLYKEYLKMKNIPGVTQFFFSPFRIPYLAPHIYFGAENEKLNLIEKYGYSETKSMRITLMDHC